MNGPTLYERFDDSRLDAPLKPMVVQSRLNGRWWVWGARMRFLATIHPTFSAAIAYATAQPAQIDAETGRQGTRTTSAADDTRAHGSSGETGA